MQEQILKLVLVAPDPQEAQVLQEMIHTTSMLTGEVAYADHVATVLTHQQDSIDLLLLDAVLLDAPDAPSLQQIRTQLPTVPVVIVAANAHEDMGLGFIQMGAQDYLVKQDITADVLVRTVCYAIQRQRVQDELARTWQQDIYKREFLSLDQLSQSAPTTVTSRVFGTVPLHEAIPEIFEELAQSYATVLDLALTQRTYRVEQNRSESLRTIAERLGFLKASPRDVVKIHSQALTYRAHSALPAKAQAYVEEGRLMVLELMGYLVSYYRNYSFGVGVLPSNISSDPPEKGGGT